MNTFASHYGIKLSRMVNAISLIREIERFSLFPKPETNTNKFSLSLKCVLSSSGLGIWWVRAGGLKVGAF